MPTIAKSRRLMLAVLLVSLLSAPRWADGAGSAPLRVAISTDNAAGIWEATDYPSGAPVDDFLAIVQALNEPSLDVVALLPLHGNHLAATAERVTRFLLEHDPDHGLDLVARGADRPIAATVTSLRWFELDGDEAGRFGPFPSDACANGAVRRLITEAERGPITILAIGPLTDVACFAETRPDLVSAVEQVVFLGGRVAADPVLTFEAGDESERWLQPLPDLNYNADPEAARIVLESELPLVLVPGTLAQHLTVDFGRIAAHDTPLARWLAGAAERRNHGSRDDVPWDSTVVNYVLRPEAYVCSRGQWTIVNCSGEPDPCAGHDGDDRLGFLGQEASQVWVDTDRDEGPTATICHTFGDGESRRITERIESTKF